VTDTASSIILLAAQLSMFNTRLYKAYLLMHAWEDVIGDGVCNIPFLMF
jgi:hypothetical protein